MTDKSEYSQRLARLAVQAAKIRRETLTLHNAMVTAREEDNIPLREIASAVKMSHETVRRLTSG